MPMNESSGAGDKANIASIIVSSRSILTPGPNADFEMTTLHVALNAITLLEMTRKQQGNRNKSYFLILETCSYLKFTHGLQKTNTSEVITKLFFFAERNRSEKYL